MEKVATAVSLAAVGCFLIAAAFLFGQFCGFKHLDAIQFLTFTDIVNYAAPTVLIYGSWMGVVGLINQTTHSRVLTAYVNHRKTTSVVAVILVLAVLTTAIICVVIWPERRYPAAFFALCITVAVIGEIKGIDPLQSLYGKAAAYWARNMLVLLFLSVVGGFLTTWDPLLPDKRYLICAERAEIVTQFAFSLDRGILAVGDENYWLIPWGKVSSVKSENISSALLQKNVAEGKSNSRPDECVTN